MEVVSACPLRAASVLWKTANGALTLTVVAKATYELCPTESPLAEAQDEPTETDEFWNDDERRSLHAPSDVAPFKRRAEVMLVGHAFAPGGQPVRSLIARLLVGEIDKSIEVFSERAFSLDGALREGPRFAKMPLRWERAAGGPDTMNPVGVRAEGPRDVYGMLPLPSLQPTGLHITTPDDFIEPVGFGPVAPSWPPRQSKLHQSLVGWDFSRWNARPLPPDLDPAFFNAAPADQQIDVLRPNERLVLENLHPDHPRLVTSLASVTPRAMIEWSGGAGQEFGMRCDTLLIDTDRGTCALTWRGQIPIEDGRRAGRVVITTARAGSRSDEAGRRSRPSMTLDGPQPPTAELPFGRTASPSRQSSPSLPAVPSSLPAAPAAPAAPSMPSMPSMPMMPPKARGVDQTMDGPIAGGLPPLPFRVGRSPLAGTMLGSQAPAAARPVPSLTDTENEELTTRTRLPTRDMPFLNPTPRASSGTPSRIDEDDETQTDGPPELIGPSWIDGAGAPPSPAMPFRPRTDSYPPIAAPGPSALPPYPPATVPMPAAAPLPVAGTPLGAMPLLGATPPPMMVPPVMVPPVMAPPVMAPPVMAPLAMAPLVAMVPPAVVPSSIAIAPPEVVAPSLGMGPPMTSTPWRPLDADAHPPVAPPGPSAPPPPVTAPESSNGEAPAPPAMIGPLATPEMVAPPSDDPAAQPDSEHDAAGSAEPRAAPPVEAALPLQVYPLERCAAIAASIARRKPETDKILEEHELAPDVWEKLDRHWTDHVRASAGRGRTVPLKAYDAAYVAQLEKERGPLRVEEYARLVVAVERESAASELAALSLPKGAMLRVQRVWLGRTMVDADLAKATRAAIDAAREA